MSQLNDVSHYWGSDIAVSAIGDMGLVSDTTKGQQRVLRRLLTNPGDYVFHPEYGAGLPSKVGSLATPDELVSLIRGQMLLEDAVAKSPQPVVTVARISGGVSVQVNYNDATTGKPVILSFSVNR